MMMKLMPSNFVTDMGFPNLEKKTKTNGGLFWMKKEGIHILYDGSVGSNFYHKAWIMILQN
jgi:hypothetical protein